MKLWALLCVFLVRFDETAGEKCIGKQCHSRTVAPSHPSNFHGQPRRTAAPSLQPRQSGEGHKATPHPARSVYSEAKRSRYYEENDRQHRGEDDCSGLYSSCRRIDNAVAFIEETGSLCPKMLKNPESFVNFLKSKGVNWTPFEDELCGDGHKFCPLAFKSNSGCIPMDANCTGAIRPRNGNDTEWGEGDGEQGFDDLDEEDDEVPREENHTPWQDDCPGGLVFCDILTRCAPKRMCSLKYLTAWMKQNNSKVTLFNESCPANTKYCLAEARCIPVNVKCHDIRNDFNGTCNASDRFCYSKFKCIPKGGDCPSPKFPRGLRHALLMQHPGQVKNDTYRFLIKKGWAQFCFLKKILHTLHLRAQRKCDTRESHCQLEGPDGHMRCLDAKSHCLFLMKDRKICTKGFNYCKVLRNNSAEFENMLRRIVHEKPQGGKCPEHKPNFCPLSRDCIRANETCSADHVFVKNNRTKAPPGEPCKGGNDFCPIFQVCTPPDLCTYRTLLNWMKEGNKSVTPFGKPCPGGRNFSAIRMKCVDKDAMQPNLTKCDEGLKFCKVQQSCLPQEDCREMKKANFSSVSTKIRESGWPVFCQLRKTICALVETSLGQCRPSELSEDACSVRDLPRCENNLRFCPRMNACVPREECHCPRGKKLCSDQCVSVKQHCSASAYPRGSRTAERPGHKASQASQRPGHRASQASPRPGHKASRAVQRPHPTRSRAKPDGRDSSAASVRQLDVLFVKSGQALKNMFKGYVPARVPKLIGIKDTQRADGVWKYYNDTGEWEDFNSCSEGKALSMPTDTRVRFFPTGGFHGVVNFTIYISIKAEAGECVTAEGVPTAVVLTLAYPDFSGIKISLLQPTIYIDEDEESPGEELSGIFNVTVPDFNDADLDPSVTKYIPADILNDYETLTSNFDNLLTGILITKPMDQKLGKAQFDNSYGWTTFPRGFGKKPLIVGLGANWRVYPRLDAHGRTEITVRGAVWLQEEIPKLDSGPPSVQKFLDKMKERVEEEDLNHMVSYIVSLLRQDQRIIDAASEELSQHFSSLSLSARDFRQFIKEVHLMELPVSRGDCSSARLSVMCFVGEMEVTLKIVIRPVNDPPKVTDPDIGDLFFPPVPFNMYNFTQEGVSVATLTKTNNKLLSFLVRIGLGENASRLMAKGGDLRTLLARLPKSVQNSQKSNKLERPLLTDENPAVGIAIYNTGKPLFGKWEYYEDGGPWQALNVNNADEAIDSEEGMEILFLDPEARLRFTPNHDSSTWKKSEADDAFLEFYGWDASDNSTSGKRVVNVTDISSTISETSLYLIVDKLGCDKRPGSMAKADLCGVCNGREKCVGCDGTANSGAKYDKCGHCVANGTVTKTDCAGSCKNTSYTDDCGVCQLRERPRRVKDCNNVCRGKPGYGAKRSCGQCVGGNTGKSLNSGKDSCGECGGNNKSCTDCRGVINGKYKIDSCNLCKDPKNDSTFDTCVKIMKVRPTSAQAKGDTEIYVGATGLGNSKVAKCWFEDDKNSKHKQEEVNIAQNKFQFKLKQIPPGKYSLKCSFDDDSTEYEYEKEKLYFFGDDTKISSASPNETEVDRAVNVTLHGAGFVNTSELVCVLSVGRGKFMTFQAEFHSSNEIVCYLKPIKLSGSFKLGLRFSQKANADIAVAFSIYAAAPVPVRCQFSNDLLYVKVTLDKRAQRNIGCGHFFRSSSLAKFGSKPRCYSSDFEVRIFLFGQFSLKVGDKINFILKSLQRKTAGKTKLSTGRDEKELIVEGPEKSVALKIELSGSRKVGPCDVFRFRVKANKRGLRYEWFARFANASVVTNDHKEDLKELNQTLLNEAKNFIRIPTKYVKEGAVYKIHVRVYNDFWNETAEDLLVIERLGKAIPVLYFNERNYTIKASSKLKLIGNVKTSRCQKLKNYKVQYVWENDHPGLVVVQNKLSLYVKKGWLVGQAHTFTLSMTMLGDRSLKTTASVVVYVEEEPLQAIIKGGRYLTVRETFTLDGSESDDPNESSEDEQYSWECEEVESKLPCENCSNPDNCERLLLPDEPVVEIPAGLLKPEMYKFKLTYRKGKKVSEATAVRNVVSGEPPELFLKVKNSKGNKVNPSDKVAIVAAVKTDLAFTELVWSCEPIDKEDYDCVDLDASDVLFSKKVKVLRKKDGDINLKSRFVLIFKPNALPGGATFRIRLDALDDEGEVKSSAYVDIKTNAAPSQGIVIAESIEGKAFDTVFSLEASEVDDDPSDRPLRYRCGCKMRKGKRRILLKYVTAPSDINMCEFFLPPGDKNNNFTHKCFMEVADVHGAISRSDDVNIIVRLRVLEEGDIANGTDDIERKIGAGQMVDAASDTIAVLESLDSDDVNNDTVVTLKKLFVKEFMKTLQDYDTEDKETLLVGFQALREATRDITNFDESLAGQVLDSVVEISKPRIRDSDKASNRRRRDAGQEEVVEVKTADEVETLLDTFSNIITPDDYRNSSMTQKEQLIYSVDELGRSLCKGMSGGEPAQVAQSKVVVLRSEQNLFEAVDKNYTNIACDECEVGVNTSAQVLLGQSLKEQYQNWQCSDQGCSGACIVSAQYPDDLLLASENQDRISDVIYIKLFNPDTLSVLEVSGLAHSVSYKVPLKSYNAGKGEPKCYAWNTASSNWSTSGVQTGEISTEDAASFINCSKNELGYVAVFLVELHVVPTTTAAATTAASSTAALSTAASSTAASSIVVEQNVTTVPVNQQDQPANVKFTLNATYDDYINESTKSDFIKQIKTSIATKLEVNETRITDLTVASGSIIVTFKLLPGGPGEKNTSSLVSLLASHVKSGGFVITLSDGRILTVDANSFVHLDATVAPSEVPTTEYKPTSSESSGLSDGALAAIIVASCLLVTAVVVGIVLYVRMKNQRAKIQASNDEQVHLQHMRTDVPSPAQGHNNLNIRGEATCEATLPGSPDIQGQQTE